MNKIVILIFSLFFTLQLSAQQKSQPSPENKIKNYVTDKTGTLSSSEISSLETKLSNFDKTTSTQVVVFMISTLDGGSLEDKSYEIAEQNGVGKKSKNNGVLLFIVKDDRKLRIEVGYGLEGALPDATCSQIIRNDITPLFKQGKYYEGINAGVDAIIKATKGEYTNDSKDNKNTDGSLLCSVPIFIIVIIFFIFFFVGMPIISRICGWGRGGGGFFGGSGGWGGGSSWGSSGGFSGGGFSGGGGSFGGGGASGSW